MRGLGYVFCLLGLLIVMIANLAPVVQLLKGLILLLQQLAQAALLYALSWQLTIGGLILIVIGLLLILFAHRRIRQITVQDTTEERLER